MEEKRKVYLIGNGHIDPVWMWRWQEGYAEVKATFQSALDRMNEFPDFVFTCSSVAFFQWVEENCPEMFEEIKVRVAEERWVICGGWWIEPDCNIPSGESFVRQGLYSQRYLLEKFGRIATAGFNIDSFGHNGMLPQIFKKSGMDYYVCMRPVQQENNKITPEGPFWWESIDGSRVLTYKIPTSYNSWFSQTSKRPGEQQKIIEELAMAEEAGFDYMNFFGVGNHGGGPTIRNINLIHELQEELGSDTIFISSPDQYFADIENSAGLSVYRGDLQHSASLCYSAHSETKKNNRRSEHRLLFAEKYAALAYEMMNLPYPGAEIQKAWEKVLFNQFHDIICGCSIKEAYEDAGESYGAALTTGAVVLNAAVQKISWSIDTMGSVEKKRSKENDWSFWEYQNNGTPFVVFNPLSWDVKVPVRVNKILQSVTDEQGTSLMVQKIRGSQMGHDDHNKFNSLFMAEVPAMGYRLYWVYMEKDVPISDDGRMLVAEGFTLENDWFKVELEPHTGYLKSIFDKRNDIEAISDVGAVPVAVDVRHCDTWGHQFYRFRRDVAKFADAKIEILETGPVRVRIRAASRYNNSKICQDFILYRDKPDLEVHVKLDWQEKRKLLKLSFPANINNCKAIYEIPYGFIERETNGDEDPGQQWVCVTGDNRGMAYGLGILNDSKYSFDVEGNDLRMTVANSSVYADHRVYEANGPDDSFCEYLDIGPQEFKYTIVPFKDDWRKAGMVKKAYELNTEPIQIAETYHRGELPSIYTGIKIDSDNIICTVFKRSEEDDGFVVRCYETVGRDTSATIDLPILNKKWSARFGKCEIKTFFISDNVGAEVVEVNLIEQVVTIES